MKPRRTPTKPKPARKRGKLTLKRAAKSLAKLLYRHLIELPDKEREEQISYLERALTKKLKRFRQSKKRR